MGVLRELFSAAVVGGNRRGDVPLEPSNPQGPGGTPLSYKAAHAPVGGVTVGGTRYPGGQFIPGDVMAKATPDERRAVESGGTPAKSAQDEHGRPLAAPKPRAPEPPAREITTTPGLPPHDAALEIAAQKYAHENYPQLRREYLHGDPARGIEPSGTFDPETGDLKSATLNTDEWRALLPGYVGTNAGAVHEAASWLNKMMLWEMLREQAGKGNNEFQILAGGGGSGKGTAVGDFFPAGGTPLVLDQVSDNYKNLIAKVDEARAAGFKPAFVFVDRPPGGAFAGVAGRALGLRKKGKLARTVSVSAALHANIAARRVALEVLEKNPEINPSVIDNRGEHEGTKYTRRRITDRDEAIAYLKQRLVEDEAAVAGGLETRIRADIDARARSGEIPPDIATGLLGHGWFRGHGAQDAAGNPLPGPGVPHGPH